MSQDDEAKKNLIQKEIIEKKYNLDDFISFIRVSIGTNTINLETWTYDEIEATIKEFHNEKEKRRSENNSVNNQEFITIDQPNTNLQIPSESDQLSNDDFIKTKAPNLKEAKLYKISDLSIEITNYERKSGGLLGFSTFVFTIEVPEIKASAKRTFSDFEWLKKTLEKYYPTTYIPPLPELAFFHKYTDNYIKKKVRYLNKFLSSLMQNVLIRSSKIFLDFVTVSEEEFKDIIDNFKKNDDPPTTIKKFVTLRGFVDISTQKEKDDYAEKLKFIINDKVKAYENVNAALKEVISEFDVVSDKMHRLSLAFDEMKKSYNDNLYVQTIFSNYKEISNIWSKNYLQQKDLFKLEFKEFFKYVKTYSNDFLKLYNDYQNAKYAFMNQYIKYDDITTVSSKEQKNLNKLRKQYGYQLNRVIEEYNLLNSHHTYLDFENHLKILNEKQSILFQDYLSSNSFLQNKISE